MSRPGARPCRATLTRRPGRTRPRTVPGRPPGTPRRTTPGRRTGTPPRPPPGRQPSTPTGAGWVLDLRGRPADMVIRWAGNCFQPTSSRRGDGTSNAPGTLCVPYIGDPSLGSRPDPRRAGTPVSCWQRSVTPGRVLSFRSRCGDLVGGPTRRGRTSLGRGWQAAPRRRTRSGRHCRAGRGLAAPLSAARRP